MKNDPLFYCRIATNFVISFMDLHGLGSPLKVSHCKEFSQKHKEFDVHKETKLFCFLLYFCHV